MSTALCVSLADDHPLFLSGLESLLRHETGLQVVAADLDGLSAIDSIRRHQPDIGILDIRMPGLSGLQVLEIIRQERLRTKIVLLTASLPDQHIVPEQNGGIWAILLKTTAADTLVRCLRDVADGKCWTIGHSGGGTGEQIPEPLNNFDSFASRLTPREREIASLVAEGMSNKQIARTVNISDGTVKIHLYNTYHKLGVTNRTSLAALIHD